VNKNLFMKIDRSNPIHFPLKSSALRFSLLLKVPSASEHKLEMVIVAWCAREVGNYPKFIVYVVAAVNGLNRFITPEHTTLLKI